jgi:hypothetical protein
MVKAYNFLGAWQLFPEKGTYENGGRPVSGVYKIEATENKKEIRIVINWVSLENQAFHAEYSLIADGEKHPMENKEFAEAAEANFSDALNLKIIFYNNDLPFREVQHELLPNGYLKITNTQYENNLISYKNQEIYHKQLSVIPYSTSVSGAVIKATEEGVIRHKALTAMEEQTNMQLEQIRKQIELLAIQAKEIQMRKELSMKIYDAKLSFVPVIGKTYYLYEKSGGAYQLSLISPGEYGGGAGPYKRFIAGVRLLADHTWMEQ